MSIRWVPPDLLTVQGPGFPGADRPLAATRLKEAKFDRTRFRCSSGSKFRCGKCAGCLAVQTREEVAAIECAVKGRANSVFYTLTVSDKQLFRARVVARETAQGRFWRKGFSGPVVARRKDLEAACFKLYVGPFIKRLRAGLQYREGRSVDLDHWCKAEDGGRTSRIHFHGILSSEACLQTKFVKRFKRVRVFDVSTIKRFGAPLARFEAGGRVARYVAQYVGKDFGSYRVRRSHRYGEAIYAEARVEDYAECFRAAPDASDVSPRYPVMRMAGGVYVPRFVARRFMSQVFEFVMKTHGRYDAWLLARAAASAERASVRKSRLRYEEHLMRMSRKEEAMSEYRAMMVAKMATPEWQSKWGRAALGDRYIGEPVLPKDASDKRSKGGILTPDDWEAVGLPVVLVAAPSSAVSAEEMAARVARFEAAKAAGFPDFPPHSVLSEAGSSAMFRHLPGGSYGSELSRAAGFRFERDGSS